MSFSTPQSFMAPKSATVTHPSLHIRDANDAHIILEAVRLGILPLITRRLLVNERDELRSGQVYVWEEAQDDGGLLRWTDGRRWSQSRMRGDYLFYEEKIETTQEERDAKAARRAQRASDPNAFISPPLRRKDRPSKPNGLTKQTYSVTVTFPGSSETRKWHVVAYFSGNDYLRLPVIEDYDYLRNIRKSTGIFFRNRIICPRKDGASYHSDDSDMHDVANSLPPPIHNSHPYPLAPLPNINLASRFHIPPPIRISLPPISALGPQGCRPLLPPPHNAHASRQMQYTPLCPEDRRVLEKFKVIL